MTVGKTSAEYEAALLIRSVRRIRIEAGLTQKEVAEKAGLRRQSIIALERGKWSPTIDTLSKVMWACGSSIMELAIKSAKEAGEPVTGPRPYPPPKKPEAMPRERQERIDKKTLEKMGRAIRYARLEKMWTQAELARRAGYTKSYVGTIECGYSGSNRAIQRLADALDMTVDELRQLAGRGDLQKTVRKQGVPEGAKFETAPEPTPPLAKHGLIDVPVIAGRLKYSEAHVHRLLKSGQLKGEKVFGKWVMRESDLPT